MKKAVAAITLLSFGAPAVALDKMPEQPGFSGYVNAGVATGSIETNMLAKVKGIDLDLGDDTINDFGSPDDESITTFALNFNLNYTFSNLKTQLSLGNDLADFLQFDRSTVASIRHDFDTLGRVQVSLVSSAFPQTEVWEDPYVLDAKRESTERDSTGGRLTWDKIFGTQFELKVESKKIELDNEFSGQSQGLNFAERALLDREGDANSYELGYLFNLGDGHLLRPSATYIDRDLDGAAMAQDGYQLAVSYLYSTSDFRWANNLSYSALEADRENPIFIDDNDVDQVMFASQMFFPGLFGLQQWEPNIALAWGESDSNIDFYDSTGWLVNLAIGRTF